MTFVGPDPYPECTKLPEVECTACCAASAAEELARLRREAQQAFAREETHPLYPRLINMKQFMAVMRARTFKRQIDCERRCRISPPEEPAPEPRPEPVYEPTPAEESTWQKISEGFSKLVHGIADVIEDALAAGKRFIQDHPVAAGTLVVVGGVVFVVVFAPGAAAAGAAALVEVGTEAAATAAGLLSGGGAVVYAGVNP